MTVKKDTLKMKNWAVVGATNKKEKYGYKIVKILNENDYNVFPINPSLGDIDGIKVYKNLSEIKEDIDVVDMVVNPQIGKIVMKEINKLGIKNVWLQPGTRSDEIREYAKENDINIVESCIYATLK
ncbi:MAG: CoA-binding protein [Halanaerobiales bacterium]|nr:CoA-binding protein [Halanaerobiales bacterium]MCF8008739.1 CoA-binding protein [Halanaerobiales bacterium]